MTTHRIKKGECLSSLSSRFGFHDPDTIHSHPDNAQLKQKRSNPNVLARGDKVSIPKKEEKTEQIATEQRHTFKTKGLRTHLRLLVEDFEGNALADKAYELTVGSETFDGKTDAAGLVEQMIPATETKGRITIWLDNNKSSAVVWPLEIGSLEPHDETRGMQARLNNLGFSCGKVDGIVGPKTKAAVKAFKSKNGLADNDTVDDATKNKIRDIYGF